MKKIENVEELEALPIDSVILGIVPDSDEYETAVWQKFRMQGLVWSSPSYVDSYSSESLIKTASYLTVFEYYLLWTPTHKTLEEKK